MKVDAGAGPLRLEPLKLPKPEGKAGVDGGDFSSRFGAAFNEVATSAQEADKAADDLVAGRVDLHEAMVTMEKADLMLKLGTTVRNKVLEAYQKLMQTGA